MRNKLARLRDNCDALMQESGRLLYPYCEVCGKDMTCMHHFFPKSTSARLRYDWSNLIPICQGCHMRHHQAGDPSIHATIIRKRGMEWYEKLNKVRHEIIKVNISYYEKIKEQLRENI